MTDRITDKILLQDGDHCIHQENNNFCIKCGVICLKDGVYITIITI